MNVNELHEVLIGYAEGTLSAERKREVEAMLVNVPDLQHDVELLQSTFQELQIDDGDNVPEHYFTNFLPRLRQKLENGVEYSYWPIPRFVQSIFQPAIVLTVMVSLFGLYQSFNPESKPSQIYSLVSEFGQNEIASIIDESSAFPTSASENIFDTKLTKEYFGIDPSNYQTETEVFALLEDQEAEQVVDRIQKTVTQ